MMTLTKVKDPKGSHFFYYKLRSYVREETYWHGMFKEASLLNAKSEVEGPRFSRTFVAL